MQRIGPSLLAASCLFAVATGLWFPRVHGQDYTLSLVGGTANPNSEFEVLCLLDNVGGSVQGHAIGVCNDPAMLAPIDVVIGADVLPLIGAQSFFSPAFYADGLTVGMVYDLLGASVIAPPVFSFELHRITYSVLAAVGTTTTLEFCDTLGSPLVTTQLAIIGPGPVMGVIPQQQSAMIEVQPAQEFRRGDLDANGTVALNDSVLLLTFLAANGAEPTCLDAANVSDNGFLALNDAVTLLAFLFSGAAPLPAPGAANCGPDPTEDLLGRCVAGCP